MRKILTIARREYFAMVGTKAFLLSITMMPILMFSSLVISNFAGRVGEIKDRKLAIIDETGAIFARLEEIAQQHNDRMDAVETRIDDDEEPKMLSYQTRFTLEEVDPQLPREQAMYDLSERVRKGELAAFIVVPLDVLNASSQSEVQFYAQESSLTDALRWSQSSVGWAIRSEQLQDAGLPAESAKLLMKRVRTQTLGLLEKDADGSIQPAVEIGEQMAIFLPFIIMMLMFMVVFLAAQPMLESVMEEKNERIAEVLLGSANPFQIMMGKLLGNVAGSLSVFALYFVGVFAMAHYKGWTDVIPFEIAPWFVAYQIVAVMFFSSVFMAVGAAVKQIKEAQSMLLPIWLLMFIPLFVWFQALRDPNGEIATWLSFFPPSTPLMMILRMASGANIPIWQPIVGLIWMVLVTMGVVFLAGRIFRVGIMWQGKTPKLRELAGWALGKV